LQGIVQVGLIRHRRGISLGWRAASNDHIIPRKDRERVDIVDSPVG
jgi:hypothetical protein